MCLRRKTEYSQKDKEKMALLANIRGSLLSLSQSVSEFSNRFPEDSIASSDLSGKLLALSSIPEKILNKEFNLRY